MNASKRKLESSPAMMGLYYEGRRIGHVLARGDEGFEAFDLTDRSLGMFKTEDDATTAIWKQHADRALGHEQHIHRKNEGLKQEL
jgi:hypothetical protein